MPEVSIIIPAYNQGHYLGEAIESALGQTYTDFEVIVVDDGSTDHTCQVAHSYSDARLRYIYQENRGLSAARNTGICNSSGQYLTFLDSDDQFLPEKLALLVKELEIHPELGMVAGQAIPVDEKGLQVGKIFDKPLPDEPRQLLLGNPLHVGSVMLRRDWQEKAGLFDEALRSYEDWDMWLRLARIGCRMGWVSRPVSLYRFHTAQMTRIGGQMTTATFIVLDKLFEDPTLPESWRAVHDRAYSNAFLRGAAQSFHAKDYDRAQEYLCKAVTLNPELSAHGGQELAARFLAWMEIPKSADPVLFLEEIFDHLPDCLATLYRGRRNYLGQLAVQLAFQAYQRKDYRATRLAVLHALRYKPLWVMNRGILAILLRSNLMLRGSR